jgi:ATP-dependent DNA ligase
LSQTDIAEESRPGVLTELQEQRELESCYLKTGVPLNKAIWIEPKLLCMIEHKSWTTQYRLQQPTFLKIVDPEEEKKEKEKKEREKERAESAAETSP